MTTHTHETEIVSDPDVPLVRITREFDAPPEKVFRAHVEPELFERWGGPHEVETRVEEWDCRTGGSYRFLCVDGTTEHAFRGCFHEIEGRDAFVASGMEAGVREGYEKLDAVLASA